MLLCVLLFSFCGCREEIPWTPVGTSVHDPISTGPQGLFLLNEGNMGSNKASLDYLDFRTGVYTTNVFQGRTQGLGDVGNDLQLYRNRLYAVINCSNLIEVIDARTAQHLGQVELANCRCICFSGDYAYATSYVGPVDPAKSQLGCVAKIDLRTLQVVDTCRVGYQPNGIAVMGDSLYVANSGGYQNPGYDDRLSVIDLRTFTLQHHIPVVINMDRLVADRHGQLWVTTPGDYYTVKSTLCCVTPDGTVTDLHTPANTFWLQGDSLYVIGNSFDYITYSATQNYTLVHTATRRIISDSFLHPQPAFQNPYAIAVHPTTGYIYIADARDYVNPGLLACYSPLADSVDSRVLWTIRTGDIPGHFAFLE